MSLSKPITHIFDMLTSFGPMAAATVFLTRFAVAYLMRHEIQRTDWLFVEGKRVLLEIASKAAIIPINEITKEMHESIQHVSAKLREMTLRETEHIRA